MSFSGVFVPGPTLSLSLVLPSACSGCVSVEDRVSGQAVLLSSTSSSLASSLHLATDESLQNLEKLTGHCSDLHSSLSGIKRLMYP